MYKLRTRYSRKISILLLLSMSFQLFSPIASFGLTSGPTQPEVNSFSPIGVNDMVDLFSGDFSYNIPLMEVGDYPLNLIYNSNPTSDQEASWVGLGWNVNPGAITRSMRGLPDDFKGDTIVKEFNIKDNKTWGIDFGVGIKLFGLPIPKNKPKTSGSGANQDTSKLSANLNFNIGINANNYKGYGINFGVSPSLSVSKAGGGKKSASLGMQVSSQDGTSLSASATISSKENANNSSFDSKASLSYNTRGGLKELTLSGTRNESYRNDGESKDRTRSGSIGASISFGYPTFNPSIEMPMHNNSFTFNGTVGGELFGIHGNLSLTGYWSKQTLEAKRRESRAYGYLNSDIAKGSLSAVMDFNREKDGAYHKSIPALPLANYTYDLFSINGQGISGQFRAHRGDVGILYDNITRSGSESTSGGIQLGFGNLSHAGANIAQVAVTTTSQKWVDNNFVANSLDFQKPTSNWNYENSYFKSNGENTLADADFYNFIGNENAVVNLLNEHLMINLPFMEKYSLASNNYVGVNPFIRPAVRANRGKRVQNISYLSAGEIFYAGLNPRISSFPKNTISDYRACNVTGGRGRHDSTTVPPRPSHHISEITITKPDGKRYVYGIPTYNKFQKDVTFASKDLGVDPASGLVEYTPNVDNNKDLNTRGIDNYYSSESTPAYAYSYLISGILSADYLDRTGNGISDDDHGEAIRFNYTLSTSDYRWRTPYELNRASYNGGLHAGNGSSIASTGGDAKGSYSYGQKEIWYTHSIESRTMVAVFKIEDRMDAMGVEGVNGGQPSPLRKFTCGQKLLRSIELYTKSDLIRDPLKAVPIKTAHFVYDYLLCKNVPNNTRDVIVNNAGQYSYYIDANDVNANRGKLTLRKVYFTYGSNTKGQLNSYTFNYSTENPDYGMKNYDRWGNYKTNSALIPQVSNAEFPYTLQDESLTNEFSRSYNLESIGLPSGGTIKVELESDDYAYVQNKRAGQMYFVEGFGPNPTTITQQLYIGEDNAYNYIFINVNDTSDYRRRYLEGIEKLYYRFFINLGGGLPDYLSGYCSIDKTGNWHGVHDSNTIWLKVVRPGDDNPISVNGWQFLRNNYPEVVYPGSSDPGNNLGDAMTALLGSFGDIVTMITGFDAKACKSSWAKSFVANKSFVRLNNGNFKKLGGGSRVKRISISDNWDLMAPSGSDREYGQEYFYADTTGGKYVSSGVANWEPVIGNEENPFKQPVDYEMKRAMAPSDYAYLEEPFGESFFPSPSVGYSKVYVANFSNENIRRTATGYTENNFFTAKEFPVITSRTGIKSAQKRPGFKMNFLGSLYSSEKWLVSQGYSIEVNDMHGKQKSVKVRNAMGHEISSTIYEYRTESFNDYKRVNDYADIITPDGEIHNRLIAQDIDLCMDMREENTSTIGEKLDYNSEGFILPIFIPLFIVIPPILPSYTNEELQFRSVVATKVVHKYGLLDKVIETKDGSTVEKQNLLRDSETGEVLLTKTTNEFDDPIYNWTYPAHWAYDKMGPAYKNSGIKIPGVKIDNGRIITGILNIPDYLCDGDEIILLKNGVPLGSKYYVGQFNGSLRVHDAYNLLTLLSPINALETVDIKVVRSGRRNMQSLPIGSLTTIKSPPINTTTNTFEVSNSTKIISASALEYNDRWKIYCGEEMITQCDTVVPEFCFGNFVNALINYNLNYDNNVFNSCAQDSISIGSLFKYCQCACNPDSINGQNVDSMLFYNLDCPSTLEETTFAQWQFGDCNLTMTSLSGNEINFDSLMPVKDSAFNGIVYTGINHTDSAFFDLKCISCEDNCEPLSVFLSPYHRGMIDNWHPHKTWNYYTNRKPTAVNASRIRDDGDYDDFTPFWNYGSGWTNSGASDPNWIATNTVTRISKQGTEIESKDALDHYSSALYGYVNSFVKAVTANAKLKQTTNDNFEDYDFRNSCGTCISQHFDFQNSLDSSSGIYISKDVAHTGDRSLHILSGTQASVEKDINYFGEDSLYIEVDTTWYNMINGCMDKFSPDSGKYILSTWVKEDAVCGPTGYTADSIVVSFTGNSTTYVFYPKGVVVEGWQRYDEVFAVPGNATKIKIELCAGVNTSYFDDFRIYPYHSNMKSFVYSSRNLRLMSELDANNYATYYEYDDEGHLVRVKKETERGIMTIKEAQTNFKKQ